MSLLQRIKADQLTARKARNSLTATLLTTLIGEAEMVGKNAQRESTDVEVRSTISKFVKNIDETLKVTSKPELLEERAILQAYLPQVLTGEKLGEFIDAIINAQLMSKPDNMMKYVMALIKEAGEHYTIDGKEASTMVREKLATRK